jgi:hypothetical protein
MLVTNSCTRKKCYAGLNRPILFEYHLRQCSIWHILDMLAFVGQFWLSANLGTVILDMEPAWDISEYCCAFFSYINILPIGLCLIDIVCFDNAGILLCLFWLYRHFASWAPLPLGPRCLLGRFASWATLPLGILCLLGCFASWAALPLGLLCLLGCFASWAALPLGLLCLLGYFASWATLPL